MARMLWRGLAPAMLLVALAAAPAHAHVFWANKYKDQIGRANLDGSALDQELITIGPAGSHPVGLAADATHVYWTRYESGDAVGRARIDGGGVQPSFIPGAAEPVGVAVDSQYVYWTSATNGTIGRARLDGGGVDHSFIEGATRPYGLAVAGDHLLWANSDGGTIGRARRDGTGTPDQDFIDAGDAAPTGLAADSTHVYWVRPAAGKVARARLDGSGRNLGYVQGLANPWGVAVDNTHVYWTEQGPPKTVGRVSLAGGAPDHDFLPGLPSGIYGVAVTALETQLGGGPFGTLADANASFSFSASEPGSFECRLDGAGFAPCEGPSTHAGLADGGHTFEVRARSGESVDPTPAAREWRVDTTGPALTALRAAPQRFRVGSGRRRGTRLRYFLDEAAPVAFELRRGGRLLGAFEHAGVAGENSIRVRRTLGGLRLRPGRYLLSGIATDALGNGSGRVEARFKVKKRPKPKPKRRARAKRR